MNYYIHLFLIVISIISIRNVSTQSGSSELDARLSVLIDELQTQSLDGILFWNLVMTHACANDYNTGITPKPSQPGPTFSSRAFAIIHGAMHDAMMVFNPNGKLIFLPSSLVLLVDRNDSSPNNAAIMEAAYQTLKTLYPKQTKLFDAARALYLGKLKANLVKDSKIQLGIFFGQIAASHFLGMRQDDGSNKTKGYVPVNLPGYHREDPMNPTQGFLGARWGKLQPFLLDYPSQYRPSDVVGATPEDREAYLNSDQYIRDFDEVYRYGSIKSSVRTPDQKEIGIFWGYDGAPKIGVPPRVYNQITRVIAIQQRNTLEQNARLFAQVNYALADAAIACWEAKYYYQFWRPIIGIHLGSDSTDSDPNWTPLGAPSDGAGINFTPGFPSYVSGHATFGSTCFELHRLFYKTDSITFEFQSDEFNGKTIDSITREPRPIRTRRYTSFSQAETEDYLSRIYLGVHWRTDQEGGKTLGRNVAKHVFKKFNQ